jgi:hypothetical protein
VRALKGVVLFVSGMGLWKLRYWAWFLTVARACLVGLVEFALYPNAIPLELIVLPYLVIKRKDFRRQARGLWSHHSCVKGADRRRDH